MSYGIAAFGVTSRVAHLVKVGVGLDSRHAPNQLLIAKCDILADRQTKDTLHYIVESDIYYGRPEFRADLRMEG
jgi:hypothetical protein